VPIITPFRHVFRESGCVKTGRPNFERDVTSSTVSFARRIKRAA
jgi:hypothetical protein